LFSGGVERNLMRLQVHPKTLALCLLLVVMAVAAQSAQPKLERGFKYIFNGKDLTDWEGDPKYWSVEDGALTGVTDGTLKRNSFIIWRGGTVSNFEMRVQVKITKDGNSGLQYRSAPLPDVGPDVLTGYQCDVVQNRNDYNGMLYEERGRRILAHAGEKVVVDTAGQPWVVGATGSIKNFTPDEWHEYRVLVVGNHHQHWIDGVMTADVVDHDEKGRRLEGLVGVQVHVGPPMKVQFKNWRVKTLPDAKLIKPEQTPIPPTAPKVVPQGGAPRKTS
jgi:3-keto-disaccharide hydrolase